MVTDSATYSIELHDYSFPRNFVPVVTAQISSHTSHIFPEFIDDLP
jgi:hypothetical protein